MKGKVHELFRGLSLGFILAPVIYAFGFWVGPAELEPEAPPVEAIEFEAPFSSCASGMRLRDK